MEMPCITIPVPAVRKSRAKLAGNRGASLAAKLMGNRGASFAVKLAGNRGVSLVEMLLCVLILTLSTGVIVSTLDLGIRHFQARTRETEQRLLCNTLSLAVQNYLTYANEILETESGAEGETLKSFRTGTIQVLNNTKGCRFVTGTYRGENSFDENSPGEPGEIAIEYSTSDATKYMPLVDTSQYIKKSGGIRLQATVDVKVDAQNKRFIVTITVTNEDGGTKDAENQFIVIPINLSVIPDPPDP